MDAENSIQDQTAQPTDAQPEATEQTVSETPDAEENVSSDNAQAQAAESEQAEQAETVSDEQTVPPAAKEQKREKPARKEKPRKKSGSPLKLFRCIYYPVMAALLVLMFVLSAVDAHIGGGKGGKAATSAYDRARVVAGIDTDENGLPHNSYNAARQETVREYIVQTLVDAGAARVENRAENDLDTDGNNVAAYSMQNERPVPSLYVQKATVSQDAQGDGNVVAVAHEVNNIILSVPGQGEDAILLYARYDSAALGGGSDATATGALIEQAVQTLAAVKSGKTYKNTVVFLFGDAGQENDLGASAFLHQFAGFDGVASRVRAVADFMPAGTGGSLLVYGGGNLSLVGKYSGFNDGAFVSSALGVFEKRSSYGGSGVFGDYNRLQFTNRGGFNRYGTQNDTKVSKSLTKQQYVAMKQFVSAFGNASLTHSVKKTSATYFSYLDVMTVYYPAAVAFVIAGIIIGLVIAIVILNKRNKVFPWGKALAGAAVQLVTLLATSLTLLALYYLFSLLLSGFGVLPYHGIGRIKFAGTGTFVSACILAVTVAIFFYIVFKRTFAVRAADVVRGNTLLFTLAAVITSFASPALAYPLTGVALFSLVAMLMTVLFKHRFKNAFGMDIERLFLYVWAIVFTLPLCLPLMYLSQTLFRSLAVVLALAYMVGLAGFIAPYADYLKPVLDKVFRKLPARTVRYERIVTEKVEDRAKKGKFTEVTVKKIEKQKVPARYLNRIGLSAVGVIAVVMVLLFSSFSTAFSSAALSAPCYYTDIYDDALVFVYEKNGDDAATETVQVRDLMAYGSIRDTITDLKYDSSLRAYTKAHPVSLPSSDTMPWRPCSALWATPSSPFTVWP